MSKIRLTKEFSFEMAHALEGYDGACREIHGHSYRFFVTVIGEPINEPNNPKNGMLLDFGVLKAIVNSTIINRYDHTLVLKNSEQTKPIIESLKSLYSRIETVDYQPTCENMISRFAKIIKNELPNGVELHSLRMHETASSFAEWFAEDND